MTATDVSNCFAGFVGGIPALADAPRGGNDFLGRLKSALLALIEELDQLPRNHPVWLYMANQSVNQHRLAEYASRLLREDSFHPAARWVRIALGLANGAEEFPKEDWTALLTVSGFDPAWLIYDSLSSSLAWSDSTAIHAAHFLRENGLWPRALGLLQALADGQHRYAQLLLADAYDRKRVVAWAHLALNSNRAAV